MVEYCGDNIVNNGEACDDGDEINNDECNNDCIVPIPGQCGLKDNATYYGDVTLTINSTELCNV